MSDALRAAVLSLEPWDQVWRRNQHFAAELVASGAVGSLLWVSPPAGGLSVRASKSRPVAGIEVVQPPLIVPRRWGGHRVIGTWLRRRLGPVDVLWVNDPVAGAAVAGQGMPAVYDVTDDWRSMPQDDRERRRIVAAEDLLAVRATTVVCSQVLADRWQARYGLDPVVIPNGVDAAAIRAATPRALAGAAPHAVYVGTLHANRLDISLVERLAREWPGTVHLVGPDSLDASDRERLDAAGVQRPGPVPSTEVPAWLVSADVLICPHVIDDFTLSLDAIKAHEYLSTDRPVVATACSGFQSASAAGLSIASAADFAQVVVTAAGSASFERPAPVSWDARAREFAAVLSRVRAERAAGGPDA